MQQSNKKTLLIMLGASTIIGFCMTQVELNKRNIISISNSTFIAEAMGKALAYMLFPLAVIGLFVGISRLISLVTKNSVMGITPTGLWTTWIIFMAISLWGDLRY